jgi:hypothetical protein
MVQLLLAQVLLLTQLAQTVLIHIKGLRKAQEM